MALPTSTNIIQLITAGDPAKYFPRKKLDGNETTLGTLDGQLKILWAAIEKIGRSLDEEVAKYGDLVVLHNKDYREYGTNMPAKTAAEHQRLLNQKVDHLLALAVPYKILHGLFQELLVNDFSGATKTATGLVLGIREGFQVVCRADDKRGDNTSPLDEFIKHWNTYVTCVDTPAHHIGFILVHHMENTQVKSPSAGPPPSA